MISVVPRSRIDRLAPHMYKQKQVVSLVKLVLAHALNNMHGILITLTLESRYNRVTYKQ